MQGIFNFAVKVVSLKERIFGSKDDPASPEARACISILKRSTRDAFSKPLPELRAGLEKFAKMISPPSEYKISEANCFGTRALLCELDGLTSPDSIYAVHLHGGGLAVGTADSVKGAHGETQLLFPLFGYSVF